jgi:hypothetical protein
MKMTEEKGAEINFRKWITKVFLLMIILFSITYGFQQYLGIPLLLDIMIMLISLLILFFLHEYLHYFVALKLGYKPEWYRTRFMMGFDIDTKNKTEKAINREVGLSPKEKRKMHLKENRNIALAPYFVCVPLSICLLVFGYSFNVQGLIYGGILGIIGHVITFPMEAKILEGA